MLGIFRKILIVALSACVMVACTDNDPFLSFSDESVNVSFTATLNNGNHGARSGEETPALDVTHLRYQVFTSTMQPGTINEKFEPTAVSGELAINGGQVNINVDFVKNQSYRIVFIAYNREKSQNSDYPYIISDDMSSMSVDYTKATAGHELFYAVTGTLQVDASGNIPESARTVVLTRPFATIALCTDDETEEYASENVNVTFTDALYTNLNLTTGFATAEGAVKSLTAAVNKESESSMTVNNKAVYKFASFNVLTHPNGSENTMSFALEADGVEKTGIPVTLTRNYLVKVAGDVVEVRAWDGITFTAPKTTPDKCTATGYALHVETPDQLAHLLRNGTTATSIHICGDMDMGGHALGEIANLPDNTTISGLNADGERKHVIFNLQLDDVHGIFGEVANNLKINNLEIGGVTLNSNSANNVGVLLGKATGSLEMTNVIVGGCTVNGSRNVGGMVGYIDGNASFAGCVSKNVTTTAAGDPATPSVSEYKTTGAMVGVFKGNTAEETLTFDADCSVEGYTTGAGAYVAQNQSCWVADGTEEWSGTPDVKYDNALGNEEFCRGTVSYGAVRIVPHWDGIRRVAPIGTAANGTVSTCEIWSPFDLAYLQEKALTSVTFKSDVDMNGKGEDGAYNVPELFTQSAYVSTDDNGYKPITSITNLDGKKSDTDNCTIYNLCVNRLNCETGNAFISYAYNYTTHKNLNLVGCQTVATHKVVEKDAKAYGAIFVSGVDAPGGYVMENIRAVDCKVFALQKIGTLASRVTGNSTLKNCSVTGCYIENYECNISERFDSGEKEILGFKARIYADFFPHGEVGGMFGFVQGSASISDCNVSNTIVHAYGQNDKNGTIEGDDLAVAGIAILDYFLVPGRHVNTFIGDIRSAENVTITNCSVDSNSKCTNHSHIHKTKKVKSSFLGIPLSYYYYESQLIGQAYFIYILDSKDTERYIKVDGNDLYMANCKKGTINNK